MQRWADGMNIIQYRLYHGNGNPCNPKPTSTRCIIPVVTVYISLKSEDALIFVGIRNYVLTRGSLHFKTVTRSVDEQKLSSDSKFAYAKSSMTREQLKAVMNGCDVR